MKVKLQEKDLELIKFNIKRRYVDENPAKFFTQDNFVSFLYFTEVCGFLKTKGVEVELQLPFEFDSEPDDERIG